MSVQSLLERLELKIGINHELQGRKPILLEKILKHNRNNDEIESYSVILELQGVSWALKSEGFQAQSEKLDFLLQALLNSGNSVVISNTSNVYGSNKPAASQNVDLPQITLKVLKFLLLLFRASSAVNQSDTSSFSYSDHHRYDILYNRPFNHQDSENLLMNTEKPKLDSFCSFAPFVKSTDQTLLEKIFIPKENIQKLSQSRALYQDPLAPTSMFFGSHFKPNSSIIPSIIFKSRENDHDIHRSETFGSLFGSLRHPHAMQDAGGLDIPALLKYELPPLADGESPSFVPISSHYKLFPYESQVFAGSVNMQESKKQVPVQRIKTKFEFFDLHQRLLHGDTITKDELKHLFGDEIGLFVDLPTNPGSRVLLDKALRINASWSSIQNFISNIMEQQQQMLLLGNVESFGMSNHHLIITSFCNTIHKFLRHLRGKVLQFQTQRTKSVNSQRHDTHDDIFDQIIPIQTEMKIQNAKENDYDNEEKGIEPKNVLNDLDKSFELFTFLAPFQTQLHYLLQLLQTISSQDDQEDENESPKEVLLFPSAISILNRLFKACTEHHIENCLTRSIPFKILHYSFVPYSTWIADWICFGSITKKIDNQNSGFFVYRLSDTHDQAGIEVGVTNNNNSSHCSWTQPFNYSKEMLPNFLRPFGDQIFKAGIMMTIFSRKQLLKRFRTINNSSNRPSEGVERPEIEFLWKFNNWNSYRSKWINYLNLTFSNDHVANYLHQLLETQFSSVNLPTDPGNPSNPIRLPPEQAVHYGIMFPVISHGLVVSRLLCQELKSEGSLKRCLEKLKSDFFGDLVDSSLEALPLGSTVLDPDASHVTLERLCLIFKENLSPKLRDEYSITTPGPSSGSNSSPQRLIGIDVVDNMEIHPLFVEWPLNLIISETGSYNQIFKFLLKLKRTSNVLNNCWITIGFASKQALSDQRKRNKAAKVKQTTSSSEVLLLHQLSWCCHHLTHFWHQIHNYILNQLIYLSYSKLMESIDQAEDFEELVSAHAHFITNAKKGAFLNENSRPILVVLEKIMFIVQNFGKELQKGFSQNSKWTAEHSSSSSSSSRTNDISLSSLNQSVFENDNYSYSDMRKLVDSTQTQFLKCVQFTLTILVKLLSRGYEQHTAALVSAINWNQYYYMGSEGSF